MTFGVRFFCVASLVSLLALFISTTSGYHVYPQDTTTTFTIIPNGPLSSVSFPYTDTKNLSTVAVYAFNQIVSVSGAASYPFNLTLSSEVARSNVNQSVWPAVNSNRTTVSVTSAHSADGSIQAFFFGPCLDESLFQKSWDLLTTMLLYTSTKEVTLEVVGASFLVDTSVVEKEMVGFEAGGFTQGTQAWEHYFSFSGEDEYSFHVNVTGKEPLGKYFAGVTVGCGDNKREFPIEATESKVTTTFEVKGWQGTAVITLVERFPAEPTPASFVFQVTGYDSQESRFWNWNAWQIAVVVAVPIVLIVIIASVTALLCCRVRRHSEYEPL